jgi:hypothetical protein
MTISATDIKKLDSMCPVASRARVGTRLNLATKYGVPFRKTVTLTTATSAAGVDVLTAAEVNGGTAFIDTAIISVTGGTAWADTTAATVLLVDTAASPVTIISYAKTSLGANAKLYLGDTGVTPGTSITSGEGATLAKGLRLKGNDAFGAGSDIKFTVTGFISGANV